MKILMAASEMAPYARTGEMAESVAELASHLAEAGNDVTVVLPFYRCVRENKALGARRTRLRFSVPVGPTSLSCDLWEAAGPSGVRLLFVERDEFFDRTGLYGVDDRDYQDNAARFIYFSKCVTEIARQRLPEIVQLAGWQSALAAVFIRDQGLPLVSVLLPMSLEFQGNFWSHDFGLTNLPSSYFSAGALEFYGSMNFLKAGIIFADAVVLPGGRFMAEAQTAAHGCGLEMVLREHVNKLEGIAPGIREADLPVLQTSAKARAAAREAIFPGIGKGSSRVFVADAASTGGAGVGMLLETLDLVASRDFFLALIGPVGDSDRFALEVAIRRHARRFVFLCEPAAESTAQLLAAGDFVLLPGPLDPGHSLFLPALRHGLVPVLEQCAGLHDIVRDFDPVTGAGNGLVYYRHAMSALADAVKRALFLPVGEMDILSRRSRDMDFSWKAGVARLEKLERRLLQGAGRVAA